MLIEALLGRGMGAGTRLNAVRPSGLVRLGYGVEFDWEGGMWHVTASASIFFCFPPIFCSSKNDIIIDKERTKVAHYCSLKIEAES